ncbi:hypothetical protein Hanom_Chr11g00997491 [Helianthus anomalus]
MGCQTKGLGSKWATSGFVWVRINNWFKGKGLPNALIILVLVFGLWSQTYQELQVLQYMTNGPLKQRNNSM